MNARVIRFHMGIEKSIMHGQSVRHRFLQTALSYLGRPYRWGGDDPSGIDCSGLVVECLKSVGTLEEHEDFSADRLCMLYSDKLISSPVPGGCFSPFPSEKLSMWLSALMNSFRLGRGRRLQGELR
ncbi:MAG: NlpC/P60 family protein [bacterium]|nr:NlpC/P60 family protein [bacterium]